MPTAQRHKRQRGSVLIVTLWTITLLTILVTAIAGQIRLSASTALFHQQELRHWSALLAAVNQARMELVMEKMPAALEVVEDLEEAFRNPAYRYNGQPLQLSYPQADDIVVRIYDHAGKINLNELSRPRLRGMLGKLLGEEADPQRLDELMAAWGDWLDLNDLPGINGAESDYYMALDPPYRPRNGPLETVEELLLIRGFAEVFANVDLDAAFTLYGDDNELVNLNLATVEAMQLLPGLDDELIPEIIAYRQEREFAGNGDVAQVVPAENMAELRSWLNSRKTSNFYTILAYRRETADGDMSEADTTGLSTDDAATHAYAEIVEVSTFTNRPRILKSNPYQAIPIRMDAVAE
jgi:general secretion pathway protein K